MRLFEGKNYWSLILGASSGMGLSVARKLASHGVNQILIHRDRRSAMDDVTEAFDEIKAQDVEVLSYNTDGLNSTKIDELIQEIKAATGVNSIKLLLHSISKGNLKLIAPGTGDDHDEYPSVYLSETDIALTTQAMSSSLLSWAQRLFNESMFTPNARIIGLTSEGDKRTWKGYAAVGIAKASLDALNKYLAVEMAEHGITSNIIQAGITKTPSLDMIPGSQRMLSEALERNPMGRLTQPEDVANAVFLLIQDEANWINGARIVVDGGESLK
jgi:enoyl-[acyl-carrier protein] reductase I